MDATRKDIARISVQEWSRPDSKEQQMLMLGQMLPQVVVPDNSKVPTNQVTNPNQEWYQQLLLMKMVIQPSKELDTPKSGLECSCFREAGLAACPGW